MKTTYTIKETQNLSSERQGETYTGTLTAAKRFASRNQFFQGTTLKIEQAGQLVAYKEYGQAWRDVAGY